jgi:hypothetical protein
MLIDPMMSEMTMFRQIEKGNSAAPGQPLHCRDGMVISDFPMDSRPIAPRSFSCAAYGSDKFVELAFNRTQFVLLVP